MNTLKSAIVTTSTVIAFLFFSGCIDTETRIIVKKDGSGILKETVLMSNVVTEMVQGMASSFGGDSSAGSSDGFNLLDEKKLRKGAEKMGDGVSFVSAREHATDKSKGYKAVYAFKDISKLRINQNPADNVPSQPGGNKTAEPEYLSFTFDKGKVSTLTIKLPKSKEKKSPVKKETQTTDKDKLKRSICDSAIGDEKAMEEAKEMFSGMRVAISVELDGKIIKTNATHAEGNRITVMEMDFAKLLDVPEILQEFAELNPSSVETVKEMVKDVPGIRFDLNEEITVSFK